MKDPHFKECPEKLCRQAEWGHGEVKRQLGTGAGLIFKGSGFYITDYRSDSYKEAAKKDAPAAGSGGGEGAKPAETSKPAAAPAPAPAPAAKSEPAKTGGTTPKAGGAA